MLDWIAAPLTLTSLWLTASKAEGQRYAGFLIGGLGSCFWLAWAITIGSLPGALINALIVALYVRGAVKNG